MTNPDPLRLIGELQDRNAKLKARIETLEAALLNLVNAKALSGVRKLVAGWNGEGRDEPYKERHPYGLGAMLPKCCGEIYALDEAMKTARAALDKDTGK
jgi:hypothetical protein